MADETRKPILDRMAALVAGPLLLGREALGLVFRPDREAPPGTPPEPVPLRIPITPPEPAIKRRG